MSTLVSPSILSADFGNLERDIKMLNNSAADWIHVDVMDGNFVPNLSFGMPIIKAVKKVAEKPLDLHLMIVDPDRYIKDFAKAGADIITVHVEACTHLHRTVQLIKDQGIMAGVTLNPATHVSEIENVIPDVDLVLVMSVNPGFGGQSFIEASYDKVHQVKKLADKLNPDLYIEVDGGVNGENAGKLVQHGANVLVAGSYVFNGENPHSRIESLRF